MASTGSRSRKSRPRPARSRKEGDKVKVTLRFRGREMAHQELGTRLLNRVKDDTTRMAKIESEPRMEGRQMVMILTPR
jgi:translation initiation factor IF-3